MNSLAMDLTVNLLCGEFECVAITVAVSRSFRHLESLRRFRGVSLN